MGFLQKLTSNKDVVFCDARNINFITHNKEKTGSYLHTAFYNGLYTNIELHPDALCNLFRGQFIKMVGTRKVDKEDNSSFYKFHAWLNTGNIIFMKQNEIFEKSTDIKFYDGTILIVCTLPGEVIREMSQLKKANKARKEKENNGF